MLKPSKTLVCQTSGLEEFEFNSPLKDFGHERNTQDRSFADMFELQSRRKASLSPESAELSKKEKKAAKRELKSKNKTDVSPDILKLKSPTIILKWVT